MKLILHSIVLCFCCLIHIHLTAQCPPSTVSLPTQQSADDFAANYPNCTEIKGTLYISGTVDNLVGLSNITKIAGDLLITGNTLLFDIAGFGSLDSIGGILSFNNNSNLDRITGMGSLDWVGGSVEIINNTELKDIDGFNEFRRGDKLQISNNTVLESIKGFGDLQSLKDLEIVNNTPLEDLSGLEKLESVDSTLTIDNNDGLTTINLNNLMTVGGQISLSLNDALTDISGFQDLSAAGGLYFAGNTNLNAITGFDALFSLTGNLNILGNALLTNIEGFDRMMVINGDIFIIGNELLADCSVQAVSNQIITGGAVTVQSNEISCSSVAAIQNDCVLPCPIGDVTLNTQAQLNNFINTYPNCTEFMGNMTIGVLSGGTSDILNISGLSSLQSISGDLNIVNNPVLTDIMVFDREVSIGGNLTIEKNGQLSECDVQAVCDYLALNGTANIQNNGTRCNTLEEVTAACTVSTNGTIEGNDIIVFPNPSDGVFNLAGVDYVDEIQVYDSAGRMVYSTDNQISTINISSLPQGIYWLKIRIDQSNTYEKVFIK